MGYSKNVIGEDRVALVTGGSSGIGLAIARELAQAGSHVWLVARQPERLSAALERVRAARQSEQQQFGATSADVADPEQAERVVDQVTEKTGVPDLLVNSAGVARSGYFQDHTLEDCRWMMDINYFGTVHMVKSVLPGMLQRASGHILNISSGTGFLGIFGYSAYAASKFAVTGFSEVLRAEMKPHGIRVSVAFLQDVDTPQLAYEMPLRPPETSALVEGTRIWSPEDTAHAILHGVKRNRFVINVGLATWFTYWAAHLSGTAKYLVFDLYLALSLWQARRKGKNF